MIRIYQAILGALLLATTTLNAANLVWIGGTGLWEAAPNWSPAQVPGPTDNVFITNSGTYTVIVDRVDPTIGSLTLGGASGTQTLSLDRTAFTLNGASAIKPRGRADLLVSRTTLAGAGDLTVEGTLVWTGGVMSGAGVTRIGAGGTLSINGNAELDGRKLVNAGLATWSAGGFDLGNGAALTNLAGAIFNVTFDGNSSATGGAAPTIVNAGLFRKTAGLARTDIEAQFINAGHVEVQAATLQLAGGGNHPGTILTAAGATLEFGGGGHILPAGSLVTGTVDVSGAATLTASGTFDPAGSRLRVTSGTATLTAGCEVAGATMNIAGGTLLFNSSGTVFAVNLTAGTLGGTAPVTVTGPLTLGGGAITSALVTANGGLMINGGTTLNGGKLVNPGVALWTTGNFTGANGAVFSNLFGATLINTFDGNFAAGAGATPTFINAGLFQKTNGTALLGKTAMDFQFLNTGTVEVRTNTLRFAFNQQTEGLTVLNGGNLEAQTQPLQLLGGSLVGTGLVSVANTENVINSATVSPGLPLGQLDIVGNYQQTASGTLDIELGGYAPGTDYDRVVVTGGGAGGNAILFGTLNVALANGFYPTNGATFTILTAVSRAGVFATLNYPSNELGLEVSYNLSSVNLTVSNLKPAVANPIGDPPATTYGAGFHLQFPTNTFTDPDNQSLSYEALGVPPGIQFDAASRTFAGPAAEAGVFVVQVIAHDHGSPDLTATNSFTITVNPAPLTITAHAQSKTYGETLSLGASAFTATGLQNGETVESVTLAASGSPPGNEALAAAGNYTITPSAAIGGSFDPSNYVVTYAPGTLTVHPAPLSVTAISLSKVYGTADPTFTASYSGFVHGETAAVLAGTLLLSRAPGEELGSYPITPSGLTSDNYLITFIAGTLTITAPAPTIISLTSDASANLLLTWTAVSNATYRLFYTTDLNTPIWSVLPGDVAAVGSLAVKSDARTTTNRFYRVQVLP